MTNDDVNKLRIVIKEEVTLAVKEEINSALEPIEDRLSNMEGYFNDPKTGLKRINQKLDALWDQTVRLTENMEEVKETLISQTEAFKRNEVKIENNTDDIGKVDKRLHEVENHLGIVPPPELTITR